MYEKTLQHLISLAELPGFRDQAWFRAKQLEADPSQLWFGIKADLASEMQARQSKNEQRKDGGYEDQGAQSQSLQGM